MANYLDITGLGTLWNNIKSSFVAKSSVSAKSTTLSWNTETEIANIDGKSIKITIPANPNTDTNTAQLQVSDTTNKRINTKESTGNYIQFTSGTNKFTVGDGTSSFDVGVTPSISNNVTYSGTLVSGQIATYDGTSGVIKASGYTIQTSVPANALFTDTDTKNTAGSTEKAATKLYLVGAETQGANPQTYSNAKVYIGTDDCLYSGNSKVLTSLAHTITVKSGVKSDGSTEISGTSGSDANPTVTLGDSGVTAGSYGDSNAQTPGYSGTFKVPYITVNSKGIVTAISAHNVTIPASDNTNTAQLQVSDTTNKKISTTESSSKYIQFTAGTNKFTVGDGTNSFDVDVTPYIANVVTGSGLTNNAIILGSGSSGIQTSSKTITTSLGNDDTTVPTSKAVQTAITSATAGLSGAMHFIGTSSTAITDGGTENPTITGYSGTAKTAGNVLLYGSQEFVWTGSAWELLGDEGSYALKTTTVTGTGVLGGGGAISSNQTITHNTSGVHAQDTAQNYGPSANVSGDNGNTIKVPQISVDKYGHITSVTERTYTSVDHTYTVNNANLYLQAGGTTVKTFSANASSDVTLNIATGSSNGTIKVGETEVSVAGLGTAAYTNSTAYAGSGHDHTLSIATDSGTNELTLAASTKYKLTAGGKTFVFTTPADTGTTDEALTTAEIAAILV